MKNQGFSTVLSVPQTPDQAFAAIKDLRGWWNEDIEGESEKVGDELTYRFKDVHRCRLKVVELVPNERIVWEVLENHFSFTRDQSEWLGTRITFDVARAGRATEVRFMHQGLLPEHECYDVCSSAWGTLVKSSLRGLITTGRGQPSPRGDQAGPSYSTVFTVEQSPEAAFEAIRNVRGWWSEGIVGPTRDVGDEFEFRYKNVHRSTQRVVEVVRNERVVWEILDSELSFAPDKDEWKGTRAVFEVARQGDRTEVRFTHRGLVPDFECYAACSSGWGFYIGESLRGLIATGRGQPESRETAVGVSA